MTRDLRFKIARIQAGLTQQQIAMQAGVPECRITAIETGRLYPDPILRLRLAEIIGKPPFELFSRMSDLKG